MTCPETEHMIALALALENGEAPEKEGEACLRHVGECAECAAALARTRRLIAQFRATTAEPASDTPCLSNNVLAELVDEVLSPVEQAQAQRHLARCGACLENYMDLARLAEALTTPSPGTVVLSLLRSGLRVLGGGEGFAPRALAPATLLDDEAAGKACAWVQRDQGLELEFTAYHTGEDTATLQVRVASTGGFTPPLRLALRSEGCLCQSEALPLEQTVDLHDLQPADYTIEVTNQEGLRAAFSLALDLAS